MVNSKDDPRSPLLQVAEVRVMYYSETKPSSQVRINSSAEAEKVLKANWSNDMDLVEEFNVLFLNRANIVKGILRLSRGGLTGTVVDQRLLFATALKGLAVGIVAAHNHPSGSCKPSKQDIDLTKKLKEIGKLHDIPLIDHLILTPHHGYFSFADEGLL